MVSDLLAAMERLQLQSQKVSLDDRKFQEPRPRKRVRQSASELKSELEKEFLTPSTTFSEPWLNKLQHRWEPPIDFTQLFELAPTQSRSVIRFTREGLEGRVTGYKEVTVPANSATAKNSTSFQRRPANRADFVRGAAGFFPFAPGGLDGVDAVQDFEDAEDLAEESLTRTKRDGLNRIINFSSEGGLLEIPPGFERGMKILEAGSKAAQVEAAEIQETLEEEDENLSNRSELAPIDGETKGLPSSPTSRDSNDEEADSDIDMENLLPNEYPALQPRGTLLESTAKKGGREWAHVVDVNKGIPNFRELVPEMAREWPFELDNFQKEAIYHLEGGDSVFVAAHTSAGKTVVAEYGIALATKHMTKAIYTSPIKALSNQKFRDFRNDFDDVGILTGDVQINPEASCLIMTTEILRSMLYRGADLIRDVEFIIFDEVHYVNDQERGVVWEEVIIMAPEHVTFILLSATVPNTYEFASWVGRTKKKDIYVISTPKRPVPLEHYLWAGKEMKKIVDSEKRWNDQGWKEANDILSGRDKIKEKEAAAAQTASNQRGSGRGQQSQQRGGARGGQQQRGGNQQRGRGQQTNRGQGNIGRTGRGGGRTTAAQDRNLWVHLVSHLRKENLLPCCVFVFSKKRCEENADSLTNQDFCTASEKSAIHMIIEKSIARLKPEDRVLPQILRLRDLLGRGVAVHHGGLLPITKEIVEILFARTLVKVLFATETFAMGLNLPTRTVVFSGYRKFDAKDFRNLTPGEYTQMAGRAGRRGKDLVGTVIVVTQGKTEAPPAGELRQMILGDPTKLRSQFRLTYNMMLNLLRVEALKIEEMIKRSFSENATQALLPEQQKQVSLSEANLAKIKREPCDICDIDLEACHEGAMQYEALTKDLHLSLLATAVGKRLWSTKRLIVFKQDGVRMAGIIVRDASGSRGTRLRVLKLSALDVKRSAQDMLPYLPRFFPLFRDLPKDPDQLRIALTDVMAVDVECVTQTMGKIDVAALLKLDEAEKRTAEKEFCNRYSAWTCGAWDELDWSKVKDLKVQEILRERAKFAAICQNGECLACPQITKHFMMQHDEWIVKENIYQLKQLMSDQNLQLLPDYQQRLEVLKDLEFIDAESRVQLKGKVACEIHSADELVLTELILENTLADFEPEEIVALLSAFVFQEKTENEPRLTASLEKGKEKIIEISEKVNNFQVLHQVILSSDESNEFRSQPRFGMVEVVYEWARGTSFNRITDLTDVMEGTIVRVVTRLDETCREVKSAAKLVGDPTLYSKMQQAQDMIKRDVIFAASLYM